MTKGYRGILIAVAGRTPQVVTETLWALWNQNPPQKISEIWVLTTAIGKAQCLKDLLDPKTGQFHSLCKEYRISKNGIRFNPGSILVLSGASGRPLEDIRTEKESRAAADQISEFLRRMTKDPKTRLHCSVAGGRKTMGVYLALSLQLYGREQDRLYHVLVNEPFESHPEFFYIPQVHKILSGKDGTPLNTRNAKIELTEIPYLRVRHKITADHGAAESDFSQEVNRAQGEVDELLAIPDLIVDVSGRTLKIGEETIRLTPMQIALYAYFAQTRKFLRMKEVVDGWVEIQELWKRAGAKSFERKSEPKGDHFRPDITRINKAIRRSLKNPVLAGYYAIQQPAVKSEYAGKYGLRIEADKIRILM